MTPHAPSPSSYEPPTRTRVKWDNIAIVLIGLVVACFAVVGILASGSTTKPPAADKPAADHSIAAEPEETLTLDGTLTAEDAQSLVDEAQAFMAEARWDEAADRLATVPEEFRATLGVEALELELAETRAEHDRLRAELSAAVEARQWKEAKVLLGSLAKIAALDAPLLEVQTLVEKALAPAPKPAADEAEAEQPAASATTSGGGAATKPKPAASTTKPKPATTRPANTSTTGGGSTRPSAGSSSTSTGSTGAGTAGTTGATGTTGAATGTGLEGALGSVNLTPAEQEELEAALAQAFGE